MPRIKAAESRREKSLGLERSRRARTTTTQRGSGTDNRRLRRADGALEAVGLQVRREKFRPMLLVGYQGAPPPAPAGS